MAAEATAGGRQVSIGADGNDDVTELSWGTRGARMIGVPAGTEAAENTVGTAAAATGVDVRNLVLHSATSVYLQNFARLQTTKKFNLFILPVKSHRCV